MQDARTQWLEALYRRHVQRIYRLCLSYVGSHAAAEDMVQETFLKLIRSRAVLSDEQHEKAWLLTTARRCCLDWLKSSARQNLPLEDFEPVLQSPAEEPKDSGMKSLLPALPPYLRPVILLYYGEEYKTAEIARILGRTPTAVRQQLRRARSILKEYLEEHPHEKI